MPDTTPDRHARARSRSRPVASGSAARCCGRPAGRWSSPCCSLRSASPRSPRCASTRSTTPTASLREQDLIDVLNGLAGTSQRAEAEIARLESTRDDLLSSTGAREAALVQAQEEADNLAILAGLVPVTGPGIRITVTEVDGPIEVQDMVDMIQELRTAGAEAIQVNGQVRVVAHTAVEDAIGGLEIGGELVTSPYVIDVIGDPHTLAAAVDFPTGPRDLFEEDGATVEVDELVVARHRERRQAAAGLSSPSPARRSNLTLAHNGADPCRPEETTCTPTT